MEIIKLLKKGYFRVSGNVFSNNLILASIYFLLEKLKGSITKVECCSVIHFFLQRNFISTEENKNQEESHSLRVIKNEVQKFDFH